MRKYRIKFYQDMLPYHLKVQFVDFMARELGVHPGSIRRWIQLKITDTIKIPSDDLVFMADFFTEVLHREVSPRDLIQRPRPLPEKLIKRKIHERS